MKNLAQDLESHRYHTICKISESYEGSLDGLRPLHDLRRSNLTHNEDALMLEMPESGQANCWNWLSESWSNRETMCTSEIELEVEGILHQHFVTLLVLSGALNPRYTALCLVFPLLGSVLVFALKDSSNLLMKNENIYCYIVLSNCVTILFTDKQLTWVSEETLEFWRLLGLLKTMKTFAVGVTAFPVQKYFYLLGRRMDCGGFNVDYLSLTDVFECLSLADDFVLEVCKPSWSGDYWGRQLLGAGLSVWKLCINFYQFLLPDVTQCDKLPGRHTVFAIIDYIPLNC